MPKAYNTSFRNVKQPRTYNILRKVKRLPDIKLKIAIQVPKTYIYTLFRVLLTTTTASENEYLVIKRKSRIK